MLGPGARPSRTSRTSPRHPIFRIEAVLIVHLLLLRIAQNVVGFLDFLEMLLGGFVAGIQVRMMLARELPVGLADFIRVGAAIDTQRFVVVRSSCHKQIKNSGDRSQRAKVSGSPRPALILRRIQQAGARILSSDSWLLYSAVLISSRPRRRTRRRPRCLSASPRPERSRHPSPVLKHRLPPLRLRYPPIYTSLRRACGSPASGLPRSW